MTFPESKTGISLKSAKRWGHMGNTQTHNDNMTDKWGLVFRSD